MLQCTIRALLIEHDPDEAMRVRRDLEGDSATFPRFRVRHASALGAGIARLEKGNEDVVLLDLGLPDGDGLASLQQLREHDDEIPVVVLTDVRDEETSLVALGAGAQECFRKDRPGDSLRRVVRHALERRRIEAQKKLHQERVLRSEKHGSLRALSAGIGFGFNVHIGTILEHCHRALSIPDIRTHTRLRADLIEVHRAASRAAEMAALLRDYAGSGMRPGRIDLSAFVLEVASFCDALVPAGVEVSYDLDGRDILPLAEIASLDLYRILVEVVRNAAESIEEPPGFVMISTGALEADRRYLSDTHGWADPQPGRYVFLRVADSGRGLARASKERIFDPFCTTKHAGRGLGLAAVAGILRQYRGVARVDARRPQGTTCTILLPAPDPIARG